ERPSRPSAGRTARRRARGSWPQTLGLTVLSVNTEIDEWWRTCARAKTGTWNAAERRSRRQEPSLLEKLPDAVGHVLRGQRAGLDKTAFQAVDLRAGMGALTISSLAFVDHAPIPARYTADGPGLSPPLQWLGVPPDAVSVA